MILEIPHDQIVGQMRSAIEWLTGPACVRDGLPIGKRGTEFGYRYWCGAIRGEYGVAGKEWGLCCPYWHTGQAVKALVMASAVLKDRTLHEDAKFCAGFLLANQREDGLFPAQEVKPGEINTSATLEAVDGLFLLSDATGDGHYREAALAALDWVAKRAWMPEKGMFRDIYDSESDRFVYDIPSSQDRPLLDDAVYWTAFRLTGNPLYRDIALTAAETLLATENPPGNWIRYIPCRCTAGYIHPRHAFWWGLPMLTLYHGTGERKYRDVFFRAVEWYRHALRRDGGIFRTTYTDFNTLSFGHATSGSACAARCFLAAFRESGEDRWLKLAESALQFCGSMQFTDPADPNLRGAILEKILPPDGTDRSPYHVRDLGTIFFLQAASEYLGLEENARED